MKIFLIVLFALLLLMFVFGCVFEQLLIRRPKKESSLEELGMLNELLAPTGPKLWKHNIPYFKPFDALPFEELELTSFDGLKLKADLIRGDKRPDITVIFCHGYKSSPTFDFAAMYDFYREQGYNLVYLHMRAHGKSQGKYIGFGALDCIDIKDWIHKVDDLFPNGSIFLHGMSMGANAAMNTADILGDKDELQGIIADCGFSGLGELFCNLIGDVFHLPKFPSIAIFEAVNRIFAGYNFSAYDSRNALSQSAIPLLYICGDKDRYVPYTMARDIYGSAIGDKDCLFVSGAGHAASFMCAKDKYKNKVKTFIERHER